jgi:hypothetical protein
MERIKQRVAKWIEGRAPAEIAAATVGVVAIIVVPGAWAVWLAWRFLRPRNAARACAPENARHVGSRLAALPVPGGTPACKEGLTHVL